MRKVSRLKDFFIFMIWNNLYIQHNIFYNSSRKPNYIKLIVLISIMFYGFVVVVVFVLSFWVCKTKNSVGIYEYIASISWCCLTLSRDYVVRQFKYISGLHNNEPILYCIRDLWLNYAFGRRPEERRKMLDGM